MLHKILIGLVIIGLITTGLTIFISDSASHYKPGDFNESNLELYNSMEDLSSMMGDYTENDSLVDPESTDDKLGSLFTSSYQSAQVLKKSTTVMKEMTEESIGNNQLLGGFGKILSNGIIIIIGIAISVGIFLNFVTRSNRT
jgi:hypothetical protein